MLLVGVLFSLVTVGFVVPCLIDVAVTPAGELRILTKPAWLLVILLFSALGAAAWLAAGRPDRRRSRMASRPRRLEGAPSFGLQDAVRRHPAGRSVDQGIDAALGLACPAEGYRPIGPDDDAQFLEELARRIRGSTDGL